MYAFKLYIILNLVVKSTINFYRCKTFSSRKKILLGKNG